MGGEEGRGQPSYRIAWTTAVSQKLEQQSQPTLAAHVRAGVKKKRIQNKIDGNLFGKIVPSAEFVFFCEISCIEDMYNLVLL